MPSPLVAFSISPGSIFYLPRLRFSNPQVGFAENLGQLSVVVD